MTAPKRRPANPKVTSAARSSSKTQRRGPKKPVAILAEEVDVVHVFTDADSRKTRAKMLPSQLKTTSR